MSLAFFNVFFLNKLLLSRSLGRAHTNIFVTAIKLHYSPCDDLEDGGNPCVEDRFASFLFLLSSTILMYFKLTHARPQF